MSFQLFKLLPTILLAIGCQASMAAELPKKASPGWQTPDILPVDEAFTLQTVRGVGKVEVLWQIKPGHYLYRHRLGVSGSHRLGAPEIPDGQAKSDEYFGDVQVYYDALIVEVPLEGVKPEQITVEYQGCSDAGICYPPQKRQISL